MSSSDTVMVPREPTEAMVAAHYEAHARSKGVFATATEVWEAMLAASPQQSPISGEGAYWLIEAPGTNYLGVRTLGRSEFYWTSDPNKALRFYSQEQADQTAMAVRQMEPDLWAFAKTLGEAWPREHKWLSARTDVRDWSEFEDDLSDAISDSIDMDWNSRDGAKAVVRWLNDNAHPVPSVLVGEGQEADGWIEWHGGENPVGETRVQVRTRKHGELAGDATGGDWGRWWQHEGHDTDIIAYRVSPPVLVPEDQGSSLRDTHRGAGTAVVDCWKVGDYAGRASGSFSQWPSSLGVAGSLVAKL